MGNLNQKSFTDAVQHNNYYYKVNTLPTRMSHFDSCVAVYIIVIIVGDLISKNKFVHMYIRYVCSVKLV